MKIRQILENSRSFFSSHFQVDSLTAAIHLRSPHSSVLREGQNLENRLHARYSVTRALQPPPSSAAPHTTGTRPPPEIHEPGSSAAGFQTHSLWIGVPEEQNKLTFQCFLSLENQNYCERSVHLSMSAQQASDPSGSHHCSEEKGLKGTGGKMKYFHQRRLCFPAAVVVGKGAASAGLYSHMHPEPPAPQGRSSNDTNGSLRGI